MLVCMLVPNYQDFTINNCRKKYWNNYEKYTDIFLLRNFSFFFLKKQFSKAIYSDNNRSVFM